MNHSQPLAFTPAIRQAGALCLTRGFLCTYGCTKSDVGNADGSSILPTSTTTGVPGFDGLLMADGQLVMVPAALGSAESRRPVRWAKFQTPTMTSTQSAKRPDVPAGRGVTNAGTLAGFGPLAPFTAPPTMTRASGNYGNGWRFFYAVSNAERTSHGRPVGYRDNAGCCAGVRYTVLSTPFARALLTKALAGTRWSAMTAPIYCRSRRACGGPVPALAGLSFSGIAERIDRIANRSVRPTVVALKAAA